MRRSRGETAMVAGRARNPCRKSRDESKPILRARTRLVPCLDARRRRVLKNSRADEGRGYPDRMERRDERKLQSRRRSYNQRRRRGVLVIAGPDKSDRAFMLGLFRLRVQPLVPLRDDAQRQRGQKRGANPARDGAADEWRCQRPLHWFADSLACVFDARFFSPPGLQRSKNKIEINAKIGEMIALKAMDMSRSLRIRR